MHHTSPYRMFPQYIRGIGKKKSIPNFNGVDFSLNYYITINNVEIFRYYHLDTFFAIK